MIDHERALELSGAAQLSSLDPADNDLLAEHLATCDACRAAIGGEEPDPAPVPSPTRPARFDRERLRRLVRRPAVLITVGAVAVTLVAGGLAWRASGPAGSTTAGAGGPSASAPSGSAGAGASEDPASGGPESSDGPDPWASLQPSPVTGGQPAQPAAPSATLVADRASAGVIPLDAGFRLASIDGTPASALAARLTVQPAFAFSVKPDADDRSAVLTPAEALEPGRVYRFALSGPAGELLDSWAFQARQPLRVVTTLPENQATDVPVNTGIEVTFDQDGVTDAASHFSIVPATPGRFEEHGRVVAFVPDAPLAPATTYSVMVSRGVAVAGTGEATEVDTRFRFETASTTQPAGTSTLSFTDQVVESPTSERPAIGMWWFGDGDEEDQKPSAPKTVRIEVYRLADLAAGVAAFRTLRARPDWTRWSTEGLVDTKALDRVVAFDAPFNPNGDAFWVQLPEALPAGWYLVQQPDGTRPSQIVLQVTDVAGYLAVSTTRTLVWANDLATGRPIAGASAASDLAQVGRTGADGLAIGDTPGDLLPKPLESCTHPCDPVVTVRTTDGRAIFLPAASQNDKLEGFGDSYYWYAADPGYWSLLHTDRDAYRTTDTVNLWGVIRDRDTGVVPSRVHVRLSSQDDDGRYAHPPVADLAASPGPTGSFTGSLAFTGLSEGSYSVELFVGDRLVRSSSLYVTQIIKPAYRLDVTTGHRVYVAGDRIKVTVGAAFFEGTPVVGVPLRIDGYGERNVTTDATGAAIYRTVAKADRNQEGPNSVSFDVGTARAEEAEITGVSHEFVIFPSHRTVDGEARIAAGKVRVSGSVHLVDVDRLESEINAGRSIWELDENGAVVRGATVTVRFVERIPVRTKVGTAYDFLEKKVVPVYQYSVRERAAGSVRVKTTAKGTFNASIPATTADHDYSVVVTVADTEGRVARVSLDANRHPWSIDQGPLVTLLPTGAGANETRTYGVGDRVDLTMIDPAAKGADVSRYLFLVAQRGIRDASIQSSPRFITTFGAWATPNMMVTAVRFTGRGYVRSDQFDADFRTSDRLLQVDLAPAATRYAPGDMATVDVRTRDASGRPIPATVVLRAVDEKLYSMGAASADDPLTELYESLPTGMIDTYASHRNPRSDQPGGGGDTGGGGDDRVDFRDSVLFRSITTDANGRGSVSFRLSDDLTSWRVAASAITSKLQTGTGSALVPVGLPFFVDATIAPEYLLADRPSIPVRAYGSAISAGDLVTVQVTSKSLGFDSGPIKTTAFKTTVVPLPRLRAGMQTLTISATSGSGSAKRTDRLTRTFSVVATHLTRARTAYVELPSSARFAGGDGFTTLAVSDASAGQYLPLLTDISAGGGARLDRGLAAELASAMLADKFGVPRGDLDGGTFAAARYQSGDGGLALLPYSSDELELSAQVALFAPDQVDRAGLERYLRGVMTAPKETRERRMFALAGLAGLGDPVLPAIHVAATDDALTIRERLMIGLGAAALGDLATARTIATRLIADYGERLGDQARLRVGKKAADITSATALTAVLAAALGDEQAPLFWAYVDANPAVDQIEVLPAVAYVGKRLERTPVKPASFAYTVDGTRRIVDLEGGRSFELTLNAGQLRSLTIERISGSIGVTTSWHEPVKPSEFQPDRDVSLTRTVTPTKTVASSDLVKVELVVKFGPLASAGCHQVTELLPSGLTPVSSLETWPDPDNEEPDLVGVVFPYDQSGPRVFFCVEPNPKSSRILLRYYARVVTPGTYAWETAVAESRSNEGQAAMTGPRTLVIR